MLASARCGFERHLQEQRTFGVSRIEGNMTRRLLGAVLCWLCVPVALVIATRGAAAQDYPNGPVRIIVQVAAGSSLDVMLRVVSEPLSKLRGLWRPVIRQIGIAQK